MSHTFRHILAATLTVTALAAAPAPAETVDRPFGDAQFFSAFPAEPGYPEGIAVRGHMAFVSGPARFGTAGTGPSVVYAVDLKTGAIERTYEMEGEDLSQEHANSCVAFDGSGRLYVVNTQRGIVRLDTATGIQEVYASAVPNLLPCADVPAGTACSPTPVDTPPLPNDIAFDDQGNLYLTDSLQATIWRIAPGGGEPQIWFQDVKLATAFGPNGLRVSPDGTRIFFTLTADGAGPQGFTGGRIYTLPRVDAPTVADLEVFHEFNGEGPDGLAFGRSGRIYVALASPLASGIAVLSPSGDEVARIGNAPDSFLFPLDTPANLAFDHHGSLIATNHAHLGLFPEHFGLVNVWVDDKEVPLAKPLLP